MKKNKILVFYLFLLLFLTGCDGNYNLTVEDDNFFVSVDAEYNPNKYEPTEIAGLDEYATLGVNAFANNDEIKMKFSNDISKRNAKFSFKYNYTDDNFGDSYLINNCFDKYIFLNEEDYYYIAFLGDFRCQYTDNININVNTKYMVLDTDAERKRNSYTWTLNSDNNRNVDHYITISKTKNDSSNKKEISSFKIICLIILAVLGSIAFILSKKVNSDSV